ncbi:MAG TPA: hypothetical protein VFK33_10555 [Bacillales bacterium]|nr:hypothetical protein [Bacillales bacterium]
MSSAYFTGAIIAAGIISIIGLLLSIFIPIRHQGEIDDEVTSKTMKRHRVLINFHLMAYIFFGIFVLVLIAYVAALFQ